MQSILNITDGLESARATTLTTLTFAISFYTILGSLSSSREQPRRSVVARSFVRSRHQLQRGFADVALIDFWFPTGMHATHRDSVKAQEPIREEVFDLSFQTYIVSHIHRSHTPKSIVRSAGEQQDNWWHRHYCRHYQGHVLPTHHPQHRTLRVNVTEFPEISLNYYYWQSTEGTIITIAELRSLLQLCCGVCGCRMIINQQP